MAGRQTQAGAVVLEEFETGGRATCPGGHMAGGLRIGRLGFGEGVREVVVLAQVVPVGGAGVGRASDGGDDVLSVEDAHEAVDFRDVLQQLGLVALHEAAGDDHPLATAGLLEAYGMADLGQALLAAGFEEAAGVDDDGVGLGLVGGDGQPVAGEQAEHAFGVDQIFSAAEADEGDGTDLGFRLRHNGVPRVQSGVGKASRGMTAGQLWEDGRCSGGGRAVVTRAGVTRACGGGCCEP